MDEARRIRHRFQAILRNIFEYIGLWRARSLMRDIYYSNYGDDVDTTLMSKTNFFAYKRMLKWTYDDIGPILRIVDMPLCTKLLLYRRFMGEYPEYPQSLSNDIPITVEDILFIEQNTPDVPFNSIVNITRDAYEYLTSHGYEINPTAMIIHGHNCDYDYQKMKFSIEPGHIFLHLVSSPAPWSAIVEYSKTDASEFAIEERLKYNVFVTVDEYIAMASEFTSAPDNGYFLSHLDTYACERLAEHFPDRANMFLPMWAPIEWWVKHRPVALDQYDQVGILRMSTDELTVLDSELWVDVQEFYRTHASIPTIIINECTRQYNGLIRVVANQIVRCISSEHELIFLIERNRRPDSQRCSIMPSLVCVVPAVFSRFW